ncbi:hypothetical protein N9J72_01885 [Candidatus Gracilibacteria bacterium]|nr:hypothetical protein [Candidatus Gracilibacteria bacterium]
MTKMKLKHIDNLRRGKKSGAKIGSRGIPHHLYKYEEQKYLQALKRKYLEITHLERVNLRNIWEKVCVTEGYKNYILEKNIHTGKSKIYLSETVIQEGETQKLKKLIQSYV